MSSGSIIDDKRFSFAGMCGTVMAGYQYRKVWSGADEPKRVYPKSSNAMFPYYVWVTAKNGQTYRKIRYHRAIPVRPPLRGRRKGEHPYTMTLTESRDPVIAWRFGTTGAFNRTGTITSCFGGASRSTASQWTANDDIKLIQRLREEMSGSDFDAGVFLGTSHQALATVANGAIKIAAALRNLKKGNIGAAAKDLMGTSHKFKGRQTIADKSSKTLSDNWLELQYGWLPLLKDMKSGAEFVAHQLSVPTTLSYKVSRKLSGVPSNTSNVVWLKAYDLTRKSIICRMSEAPSFATLAGLRDPSSIAWELMPWSFVVDWALPIGDYLQARSFTGGLRGTFITTKKEEFLVRGAKSAPGSGTPMDGIVDSYFVRSVTMERTISSSLVVPFPVVKPFSKVATWGHAENALALLTQVVYKGKATYNRKLAEEARELARVKRS